MKTNIFSILLTFCATTIWGQNNYQDINKALNVCKSSTLTFSAPQGYGVIDDLKEDNAKGCLTTGEQNSIWLKVTISKSGQFGFNINNSGQRDYDFSVYTSVNVNASLNKAPIRCSFVKTTNTTGVGDSTQTGFEEWIPATQGQIYYILINSTQTSTSGNQIQLELTGTAEYDCIDTYQPELPLWTSESICGKDFIQLNAQPTNLSSGVQIYYEWEKDGVVLDYNDPVLTVTEAGTYTVSATANLFPPVTQSVIITGDPNDPPPTLELDGHDSTLYFCEKGPYPTLKVKSNSDNIKWFFVNRGILYDTGVRGNEFTLTSTIGRFTALTYVAIAYNKSECSSKSIAITLLRSPKASISGKNTYTICNGQNPTLTVTSNNEIIEWYDKNDNLKYTGATWNNVPKGEYYAIAKGTNCDSDPLYVNVVDDVTPTGISANDVTYCSGDDVILKIDFKDGIGESEATVKWYDQEQGGRLIGTGNPFVPKQESGTYWAEVSSNSYCTQPSERIQVNFTLSSDSPTLTVDSQYYGFCQNQVEEIVTVTSNVSDNNVLWYTDNKGTTPLLDTNGSQVKGKRISVTSAGNYWVQAVGANNCKSLLIQISVLNYNAPQLKNPPSEIYSCGNNDVETPTLTATNNTVDMSDPNSIEWYSDANLDPKNLLGKGNNFIIPKEYIGKTVYVRLVNVIGCFSITYPINIVYNDIPSINPSTDLEQFYCQDIAPNPLGAITNDDGYEIIWYNSDGIERGRTKNGQTINPNPDDYATNEVTIYYAEAVNPASGCTSERLQFTFTKIKPPVISSDITELAYCRDSEYEELNISITNGDPLFIKWFDATNTEVGTGTKLIIVDVKNGIDLGDGEFYATASSDGKNCASNTVTINVNELDISNASIQTPLTTLFEGDQLELSTTVPEDIESYLWTGPNGFSSTSATPIIESITLGHNGQYNVLISNKCESKSLSIDIEVYANGETAIGEDKVVCKEETFTHQINISRFYPDGKFTYRWYGPNGFSSTNEQVTIDELGRYLVTITDTVSNHSTTGSLAVYSSSLELTNEDVKTCYNQTLLQPTGGQQPYQYALDNGTWQSSPIFTNISEGFHTYKIQDANGCKVETSREYYTPFILRKVFTPNGDGYNDLWDLSSLQDCTKLSVKIFDRYGRYLHQIRTHNLEWNGNINGKPLPDGTYWYVMEFNDGVTPVLKGHITIRRTKD